MSAAARSALPPRRRAARDPQMCAVSMLSMRASAAAKTRGGPNALTSTSASPRSPGLRPGA